METLIHADIFFFITTIVVIGLGILLVIISVYIITILSDIRKISRIAHKESVDIAEDIHVIRREVSEELMHGSSIIFSVFKVLQGLFKYRKTINRSNKNK